MTTDQLTKELEDAIRERDEARRERDALKEAQKRNNETVWRWRREVETAQARIEELKIELWQTKQNLSIARGEEDGA